MGIDYEYFKADIPGEESRIGENLARHHIISRVHMFEFAVILLAYFQMKYADVGGGLSKDSEFCRFMSYYNKSGLNEGEVLKILGRREIKAPGYKYDSFTYSMGDTEKNAANQTVWTRANLFTGPDGRFRYDDPGQDYDGIPFSMPDSSFSQQLYHIRAGGIPGRPAMEDKGWGYLALDQKRIFQIAETFIHALPPTMQVHDTKVSDWRAVMLKKGQLCKESCYKIFITKNRKNHGKEIGKFRLGLVTGAASFQKRPCIPYVVKGKVAVIFGTGVDEYGDFLWGVIKDEEPDHCAQQDKKFVEVFKDLGKIARI